VEAIESILPREARVLHIQKQLINYWLAQQLNSAAEFLTSVRAWQ